MQSRWFRAMGAVLFGLLLTAAPALAVDLASAKASGQVGEQLDGYVGLVKGGASEEVQDLVREVNSGRREKYVGIARKRSITVQTVAAQAGAKLVGRVPEGQWVKDSEGKWLRK